MKVGDLIKVLQGLNPESSFTLSLGRDDEYRIKCAKAELTCGECLGFRPLPSRLGITDASIVGFPLRAAELNLLLSLLRQFSITVFFNCWSM